MQKRESITYRKELQKCTNPTFPPRFSKMCSHGNFKNERLLPNVKLSSCRECGDKEFDGNFRPRSGWNIEKSGESRNLNKWRFEASRNYNSRN